MPENASLAHGNDDFDEVETILLVEDEAQVRRVVSLTLELQGYRLLVAENAVQALRLAAAEDDAIALLLTDVILPGMSGPKLYEELRSKQENLRVLFISGYADEVLSGHGISSADAHFLAKPFSSATLGRKLRQLLRASPR